MRQHCSKQGNRGRVRLRNLWLSPIGLIALACTHPVALSGQTSSQENVAQQVQQLTAAMARTQAQLEESQHELEEMRRQLATLQQQMARSSGENPPSPSDSGAAVQLAAQVAALREQEAVQDSQIATQDQAKVESESKYPVKVSGLILLNGFVNTQKVDIASTPTIAIGGSGSTGLSLLQTVLGLDARGPHLFGARSLADVRVDFNGSSSNTS